MRILSFDVASKSLAVSIVNVNGEWRRDLREVREGFGGVDMSGMGAVEACEHVLRYVSKVREVVDGLVSVEMIDVVDLIPGEKLKGSSPVVRANRLRAYLDGLGRRLEGEYKVLLEYQMGPNDKSRSVCSQLLYHFSCGDGGFRCVNESLAGGRVGSPVYDVEIVGPSLKNKISFDKPHQYFVKKYAKMYDANKKHSVCNLEYWVRRNKLEKMVERVPKKNMDDVADSVMMALAWVILKSGVV